VTKVAKVSIAAFQPCTGQVSSLVEGSLEGMAIIGTTFQSLNPEDEAFFIRPKTESHGFSLG
jgi:hypothetical protein